MAIKHLEAIDGYLKQQKEPVSMSNIRLALGLNYHTASESLDYLKKRGDVIEQNGKYRRKSRRKV